MSQISLTRRALLQSTAIFAAATALPLKAFAQEGGRLVVAADSEPKNLNPAVVASNGVFFISSKVVEPLAEASFEGKDGLAPRLATSWEGSADGLSVTFKLREGVTWHDGKPFTSADVAFSALNVWKPLQNLGRLVFANLEAVDTPDEHTASSSSPSRRRSSSSATRCRPSPPSSPSMSTRAAPTSPPTRPTPSLPAPARSSSPSTSPANITGSTKNDAYWGEGQPKLSRNRLPRAARPRGGGRRARGRRDPARRLQPGAARRPRPHLQGRGHKSLFDRL